MIESRPSAARTLQQDAAELVRSVKPKLRGWLHAGMTPLAAAAGIVLVCLAPTTRERLGAAAFAITAVLLFATSAAYHRGTWSTKVERTLKRMDHSNIFLIIAGTYTPFAVTLLRGSQELSLLLLVWGGAILGVLFRVFWVGAPRWLYTPIYVALGWVAIFYFGPLLDAGGAAVMTLIAVGGGLYTLGAIVYGIKKPNPSPQWFGFHEVFHSLTILAFVSHYIAASLAIYSHHR
ncbi:PAQR family membrane homeostasis protein TrhA [Flexivirga alba]|uniref:Hemolysin III family protein n=1 Tax=Flexivirga alba TaxID=702742 RepID=A0ABW2AND6_9MICO